MLRIHQKSLTGHGVFLEILNPSQIQNRLTFLEKSGNCKILHSSIENQNLGIMTTISNSIVALIKTHETLIHGRAQRTELKNGDLSINIINIYGPAQVEDRSSFFKQLTEKISRLKNKIIIGDWNAIWNENETSGKF